jgi:hypothetical protein
MTTSPDRVFDDGPPRPLDDLARASNHLESDRSTALSAAANNLLAKALRRLEAGEEERARTLVERALSLPDDDREGMVPALMAGTMLLFMAISDDLESSPADDGAWLDRAETLMDRRPGEASEIRSHLRALLSDLYELTPSEGRRLKALTRGIPLDVAPLADVPADTASRTTAIVGILEAVIEHRTLVASSTKAG